MYEKDGIAIDEKMDGTRCRHTSQKYYRVLTPWSICLSFNEGIEVMQVDKERKSTKLKDSYTKDFTKSYDKLSPVSFQLHVRLPATSRIHDVFHCSLLKPAHDSDKDRGVRGNKLPVATNSGEYEVEKILTKRGEYNHIQYLIKWKGYPMEDCS